MNIVIVIGLVLIKLWEKSFFFVGCNLFLRFLVFILWVEIIVRGIKNYEVNYK